MKTKFRKRVVGKAEQLTPGRRRSLSPRFKQGASRQLSWHVAVGFRAAHARSRIAHESSGLCQNIVQLEARTCKNRAPSFACLCYYLFRRRQISKAESWASRLLTNELLLLVNMTLDEKKGCVFLAFFSSSVTFTSSTSSLDVRKTGP